MKIVAVWKVQALRTGEFRHAMFGKGLRRDPIATLLNICAGFNFFYETTESFGDVTEETALRIADSNKVSVKTF